MYRRSAGDGLRPFTGFPSEDGGSVLSSFCTKMWHQKASLLNREDVLKTKTQLTQYNMLFREATATAQHSTSCSTVLWLCIDCRVPAQRSHCNRTTNCFCSCVLVVALELNAACSTKYFPVSYKFLQLYIS